MYLVFFIFVAAVCSSFPFLRSRFDFDGVFVLFEGIYELGLDWIWQMSTDPKEAASRLRDLGLLRTQGLVGGKWVDAYDGKTFEVMPGSKLSSF